MLIRVDRSLFDVYQAFQNSLELSKNVKYVNFFFQNNHRIRWLEIAFPYFISNELYKMLARL